MRLDVFENALGMLPAADYAGSGVVHAVGGFVALAGAAIVGPRLGKFNANGTANPIVGHNVPYVVIGTFILFFGWFGFNINTGDSIGLNAANTLLSGATGAVVALYIQLIRTGKADILMACNGALAGLVGITAPVAFVEPWSAVVIGAISAPIMIVSVMVIENVLKIDDPVGAVSVHGVTGLWGLLAVGIFANGNNGVDGLIAGNSLQIVSQLISMAVVLGWSLGTGFVLFMVLKVAWAGFGPRMRSSWKGWTLQNTGSRHTVRRPAEPYIAQSKTKVGRPPGAPKAPGGFFVALGPAPDRRDGGVSTASQSPSSQRVPPQLLNRNERERMPAVAWKSRTSRGCPSKDGTAGPNSGKL